jgi:hypothetical protein
MNPEEIRWMHRSQDHDPAGKLSWQDVAVEQPMR